MVMKFTRESIVSVEYAQCCEAKDDEAVNGDTVCFFDTDKQYFYTVIADGMGSGKTAAATSRLSCVFLEKMLSAGTPKSICIEMLNNLLLSKNDETFSGIDLLEIDKLCGKAYFIKAGAAPSFILRKSRLYKICSETPPVGIIPTFSAESTRFALEKGDIIFMVSDGVMQSDSDAEWLSSLIRLDCMAEPAFLAGELIEKSRSINKRKDDSSVCIIKIN
jgi:stage II sporulation protein E